MRWATFGLLLSVGLTACGGLLGFGDDPAGEGAAATVDASADVVDGAEGSSDGSSGGDADASVDPSILRVGTFEGAMGQGELVGPTGGTDETNMTLVQGADALHDAFSAKAEVSNAFVELDLAPFASDDLYVTFAVRFDALPAMGTTGAFVSIHAGVSSPDVTVSVGANGSIVIGAGSNAGITPAGIVTGTTYRVGIHVPANVQGPTTPSVRVSADVPAPPDMTETSAMWLMPSVPTRIRIGVLDATQVRVTVDQITLAQGAYRP